MNSKYIIIEDNQSKIAQVEYITLDDNEIYEDKQEKLGPPLGSQYNPIKSQEKLSVLLKRQSSIYFLKFGKQKFSAFCKVLHGEVWINLLTIQPNNIQPLGELIDKKFQTTFIDIATSNQLLKMGKDIGFSNSWHNLSKKQSWILRDFSIGQHTSSTLSISGKTPTGYEWDQNIPDGFMQISGNFDTYGDKDQRQINFCNQEPFYIQRNSLVTELRIMKSGLSNSNKIMIYFIIEKNNYPHNTIGLYQEQHGQEFIEYYIIIFIFQYIFVTLILQFLYTHKLLAEDKLILFNNLQQSLKMFAIRPSVEQLTQIQRLEQMTLFLYYSPQFSWLNYNPQRSFLIEIQHLSTIRQGGINYSQLLQQMIHILMTHPKSQDFCFIQLQPLQLTLFEFQRIIHMILNLHLNQYRSFKKYDKNKQIGNQNDKDKPSIEVQEINGCFNKKYENSYKLTQISQLQLELEHSFSKRRNSNSKILIKDCIQFDGKSENSTDNKNSIFYLTKFSINQQYKVQIQLIDDEL
ncbi:hypothetical protein pb186bvf_018623 [Paramecium bursaria]